MSSLVDNSTMVTTNAMALYDASGVAYPPRTDGTHALGRDSATDADSGDKLRLGIPSDEVNLSRQQTRLTVRADRGEAVVVDLPGAKNPTRVRRAGGAIAMTPTWLNRLCRLM